MVQREGKRSGNERNGSTAQPPKSHKRLRRHLLKKMKIHLIPMMPEIPEWFHTPNTYIHKRTSSPFSCKSQNIILTYQIRIYKYCDKEVMSMEEVVTYRKELDDR